KPICDKCEKPAAYNVHTLDIAFTVEGKEQLFPPNMIDGTGNKYDHFFCEDHMEEEYGKDYKDRFRYGYGTCRVCGVIDCECGLQRSYEGMIRHTFRFYFNAQKNGQPNS